MYVESELSIYAGFGRKSKYCCNKKTVFNNDNVAVQIKEHSSYWSNIKFTLYLLHTNATVQASFLAFYN
jgi:hypothetical protein